MNQEKIGKFIQELRKEKKLTQEELAKRLGKSRSHITNMLGLLTLPSTIQEDISSKKITNCINLLKRFNAVSVREKSAVNICEEQLGVSARHVLDPTMLLNVEDYATLFNKTVVNVNENHLLVYILDNNDDIKKSVENLSIRFNLNSHAVNAIEVQNQKSYKYKFPSVENWLRGFYDAKYVITDSFHGTVFSIIFNKPFICLGNENRGSSRFNSLLGMFGLENRLVSDLAKAEEFLKGQEGSKA